MIPEGAVSAAWEAFYEGKGGMRKALEAAAPHMMAAALAGHINRGPLEGFVGERCECGYWSNSDVDYIDHIKQATK